MNALNLNIIHLCDNCTAHHDNCTSQKRDFTNIVSKVKLMLYSNIPSPLYYSVLSFWLHCKIIS